MSQTQQIQQAHTFATQTVILPYLVSLPEDYNSGQRWPLVLFLHGSAERGQDVQILLRHGPPKLVEAGQKFPFLLVSPQCPSDNTWSQQHIILALTALLDEIEATYAVDPDRIYVTGLSLGGIGTWRLATEYPHRFAAIAPVCGFGNPSSACAIRHVPVCAFHGADDEIVPLERGQATVDALRSCGGNVTFIVYPGVGHNSWTQTYANPELYTWLLKQRRI